MTAQPEAQRDTPAARPRVAVFASGGGTNLQALLDHFRTAAAPARIGLVVSDREAAGALERAARAGVPARVIPVTGRDEADVARDTLASLEEAGIDIVALAGYLRLVPADVVRAYHGRILNIHPALLPAFGGKGMYGLRIHRAVLSAGCRVSGATVHLVDEAYDQGRILVQWPVPVREGDAPESLAERVLRVEHAIYPLAVEAVARAVANGTPIQPFTVPDAGVFELRRADAPAAAGLRRAFGLPPSGESE